jgi:SAM-dependent methyltransferase
VTEADRRERRALWDERHREREIESDGPDSTLVAQVSGMTPGRAMDVACGSGTNAVWLAARGWRVTGVDWSAVALEKARARAARAGVEVTWIEADLLEWTPPPGSVDLVTVLYLHLVPDERRVAYAAVARAVAPGGHLLVIGHDREHQGHGPDPDRLFTAAELGSEIRDAVPDMVIDEALVQRRAAGSGAGSDPGAVDAVLRMTRARVG